LDSEASFATGSIYLNIPDRFKMAKTTEKNLKELQARKIAATFKK
jgi:hypothetical protein